MVRALTKLLRAVVVTLLAIALIHVRAFGDTALVSSYAAALAEAPAIFLGVNVPSVYPSWYAALILFVRLVFFGFFMSIILKRFNRR